MPDNLKVTDAHIKEFSDAIIAFWNDVPEEIYYCEVTSTPKWLEKAIDRDLKERRK